MVIIIFYSVSLVYQSNHEIEYAAQYNVKVIKVLEVKDKTRFIGEIKGELVSITLSDEELIKPGDVYTIKGELTIPRCNTIPNGFNYRDYLKSKKIYHVMVATEMRYQKSEFDYHIISFKISNYIEEKIPLSKSYIKTFILADKTDFDHELISSISSLGISHLFAVSGFHVALLVIALKKLLIIVIKNENRIENIIILILITYMVITSFAPSITRAVLMYILLNLNKRYRLGYSVFDILSVIFIVLLIINPFYYLNLGFLLSFLVTTFIVLNKKMIADIKWINSLFYISVIAFISTIPVVININNQINLLSLFINIIFIIGMSYIILPCAYIVFLIPKLDSIYNVLLKAYNMLIELMSVLEFGIINGRFNNIYVIIIFYILIIYIYSSLITKKRSIALILVCLIITVLSLNSSLFDPVSRVVFLDVKGDATLITDSFNKCNILIDTGESDDYDAVLNYISSRNVKKLDYLIVSHFHSDHMGEVDDILSHIEVDNVITKLNVNIFEGELIKCGKISLYIYPLSYDDKNENNNSILLSLIIEGKHFLFTGDAESKREKEFVDNYMIDVDYLKIAHHGSDTSSSIDFLNSIKPNEAFIIVRRNNYMGHPSLEVINQLIELDIDIFRTDEMGSIEIAFYGKQEKKIFYTP